MKRFWLLSLLMAVSLVTLQVPAFAADEDATEDMNSALGSIKGQVTGIDAAVKGIGLYGDVRVKYSWKTQSGVANAAGTAQVIPDQDNEQIRARIGVKKTLGDVTLNLRLVTDATANYPNSQTPSLGDALADQPVYFDTASLAWTPGFLNKQVSVGGGKFQNVLDYTPITWDDTLTQDGAWVSFNLPDTNTTLRSVYIDYANPQATKYTPVLTPPVVEGPAGTNGANNSVDSYIWTTQLSQLLKFDKDTNLNITLGYEYIPYVTQINALLTAGGVSGNNLTADGMVLDYGSVIPDIQLGEVILTLNNSFGADLPAKWTLHAIDNMNSFNLPNAYLQNTAIAGAPKSTGYSNLSNNMGYWFSVDLGKGGDSPAKDTFTEQLAVAYVEPNAQLSVLTDHDGNFTNTEYLRSKFNFGLENGVSLQWKTWVAYHVYYEPTIGDTTTANKLASGNQTAEWINFFYATASF